MHAKVHLYNWFNLEYTYLLLNIWLLLSFVFYRIAVWVYEYLHFFVDVHPV